MRVRIVRVGALPWSHGTCRQVVVSKGICGNIRYSGVESLALLLTRFYQCHQVQVVLVEVTLPAQRDVTQHLFPLLIAAIGLTMTPYEGGVEVGVLYIIIGERPEGCHRQSIAQVSQCLQVHVEVSVVLAVFHLQQRVGVVDP